jgi:hypothetical protein
MVPAQGQAQGPVQVIGAEGEVVGEDSSIRLRGLFGQLLGADPAQGLELITVGGKSYVRGPVPLLGAPQAAWYALPEDGSSPANAVKPGEFVGGLTGADLDLSGFAAAGEEQLDGRQCRVFVGDKEATERAFARMSGEGLPGPQSFEEVRRAEMKFWVCEDGYFHKLTLDSEGVPEGQTEPVSYLVTVRLFDFDADITIAAPPNPSPLETTTMPGLPTATTP